MVDIVEYMEMLKIAIVNYFNSLVRAKIVITIYTDYPRFGYPPRGDF